MRRTSVERRTIERFRGRYGAGASRAERAVEIAGIGAYVGSNGYTTIVEAGRLGQELRLRRGARLLDIGCGRGYPGLYLARSTGCSVVGVDLPLPSLSTATARARRERLSRRADFAAASALHLPFRRQSFDAISHTDVLC